MEIIVRLGLVSVCWLSLIGLTLALDFGPQGTWPFGSGVAHAGSAILGGRRMTCARAKIRLNSNIPGVGFATPGRIALNPRALKRYSSAVRRMIFLHECAHQYVGGNEAAADCWAVRRAKRQGWLTRKGIRQVCASFNSAARCRALTRCFLNR